MALSAPHGAVRSAGPVAPVVQYVRFEDVPGRRVYRLLVRQGDAEREYAVSIERDAFTRGRALVQDGPDIAYQTLLRELANASSTARVSFAVTDGDLADYRDRHAPAPRRATPPRLDAEPVPGNESGR